MRLGAVGDGTDSCLTSGTVARTVRPRGEFERIAMLKVLFLVAFIVTARLFGFNSGHLIANHWLSRAGAGFYAGKRVCVRAKARFSRSRILIGVAFFTCFDVNSSTTYRDPNCLTNGCFCSFQDFSGSYQAFIFHTNFQRPNFRGVAIIINSLLSYSVRQVPINIRVGSTRGSEGRWPTIIRVFVLICFFGSSGLSINKNCSCFFHVLSRGTSKATRRIRR